MEVRHQRAFGFLKLPFSRFTVQHRSYHRRDNLSKFDKSLSLSERCPQGWHHLHPSRTGSVASLM